MYLDSKVFDLQTMISLDGFKIYQTAREITENIAYYVPRNVDIQQVSHCYCYSLVLIS